MPCSSARASARGGRNCVRSSLWQHGATLIMVAPCCHKELRTQLRPPRALARALEHGILRERHAEFVTDALRAALLEWAGYDTKVFEFVSTEHTAKNLMIAGVKRPV